MPASPARDARTSSLAASPDADQPLKISQLEKQLSASEQTRASAEFRSEVLQARQDLQDAAYSRLEIGIGLFGLLITLLVIAFGFRTEKAAARAARGELADRQKELDEIIAQSRSAADAASRAATAAESASISADTHAKTAANHAETAKAGADSARAATVNSASPAFTDSPTTEDVEKSISKPPSDRTSQDFKNIIISDIENENWSRIILTAREMQCSAINSKEDYIFSLFQEAFALGKLDQTKLEVALYDKIIDMYSESDSTEIKIDVAASIFNRGLSKSIISGNFTETEDFDKLIEEFGEEQNDEIKHLVAESYLQRATAFGESEKVSDCILALRMWSKLRGGFDCHEVVGNVFFARMKNRPTFARFLTEMGCG